jgi:hypothetical protein
LTITTWCSKTVTTKDAGCLIASSRRRPNTTGLYFSIEW